MSLLSLIVTMSSSNVQVSCHYRWYLPRKKTFFHFVVTQKCVSVSEMLAYRLEDPSWDQNPGSHSKHSGKCL